MPFDVAAQVISNERLSADYNVLALAAPAIAEAAAPGQFVMVKAAKGHDPLLRRPFSVFEILRDSRTGAITGLTLLNKRIGPSTRLLYEAEPEQLVACFGPLGRPFTVPASRGHAWMVAGGVGLAPFAMLAETLQRQGTRCTLFYGARTGDELFYLEFFRKLGVGLVLTTEDGSTGARGRITGPLEERLAADDAPANPQIYACGPEGMLAACAKIAARFGRPCEVSVERIMGCGMGGCYSCVVPMRDEHGIAHHVRSCIAGPVLAGDRIVWD